MSVVRKLLGTIEDKFWIFQDSTANLLGTYLENDSGNRVNVRDAATNLIPVRGADGAVGTQDFATMVQLGAVAAPPEAMNWISIPLDVTTNAAPGATASSTYTLPTGARIMEVRVGVSLVWDSASTLVMRVNGEAADFQLAGDQDLVTLGTYVNLPLNNGVAGAGGVIDITMSAGAATAGQADVLIGVVNQAAT